MSQKVIKFQKNYLPNIDDLVQEEQQLNEVIHNICNRYKNENNINTLNYCLEALEGYRYVPNKYLIPSGTLIRFLDTYKPSELKLRLGGFVINDTGYRVTFKSNGKIMSLQKKNSVIFSLITQDERFRLVLR